MGGGCGACDAGAKADAKVGAGAAFWGVVDGAAAAVVCTCTAAGSTASAGAGIGATVCNDGFELGAAQLPCVAIVVDAALVAALEAAVHGRDPVLGIDARRTSTVVLGGRFFTLGSSSCKDARLWRSALRNGLLDTGLLSFLLSLPISFPPSAGTAPYDANEARVWALDVSVDGSVSPCVST